VRQEEANAGSASPPRMTLPVADFLQRWLLHVPVPQTRVVRGYGRAGRCRGLCRYCDLLDLKVHVWIPALEDGAQFPVECPHSSL
jgi:hypothetical protein